MKLSELIKGLPPVRTIPGARQEIAKRLTESRTHLVVVDDDPTGTQTVHGVRVYMDWSVDTLRGALTSGKTASFMSANTRALSAEEVARLAREIGSNIREAAEAEGVNAAVASRSDSTLRGHFPCEVDALLDGLGCDCDGVVIAPAFFDAGRYTVNDIHWVDQGDRVVPASETEFARDPTFAYTSSNLRDWVEEKTAGKVRAADVVCVSIDDIRLGGPEVTAGKLRSVSGGTPVVVNAACYEDLEVFMLGLVAVEQEGKRFIYRCAAPFVKVRGGIVDRPLLTQAEMSPGAGPGLIVTGSYVGKTSRQLDALLSSGLADGLEMRVSHLLEEGSREREITRAVKWVDEQLASGTSAAVFTSREVLSGEAGQFLDTGQRIMCGLCEVVSRLERKPAFVLAKGGITSMEVARLGLGVKGAGVLGQILPGVPVWRLDAEVKWPGIPYVVFPGNVGGDDAVLNAVKVLSGG